MNTEQKDNVLMKVVIGAIAAMLIFAVIHFLTNDDGGATGGAVIGQEGAGFWTGAVIFGVLAVAAVVLAVIQMKKGNSPILFFVVAAIFLGIAFGKGCTDKANGGVTTEQGRPGT